MSSEQSCHIKHFLHPQINEGREPRVSCEPHRIVFVRKWHREDRKLGQQHEARDFGCGKESN